MNKQNSVKKDIWLVLGSVVGFYLLLILANYAYDSFGVKQAFAVVDLSVLALKVTTASALVWILNRVVFSNTLGKDFGKTFNDGWDSMSNVEKSRWILGTFVVLFASILAVS